VRVVLISNVAKLTIPDDPSDEVLELIERIERGESPPIRVVASQKPGFSYDARGSKGNLILLEAYVRLRMSYIPVELD